MSFLAVAGSSKIESNLLGDAVPRGSSVCNKQTLRPEVDTTDTGDPIAEGIAQRKAKGPGIGSENEDLTVC
jgi:hypothetical protein